MKKQFAAIFAATAVLGVTTAFAANPFSDVTPDSWAYQAVSQLAATGIVNGYPDGTFKGQNNITRYEMAQMVAKAMANQDRANAEQQAMINRLADEFSNELNNLGVRVARLEDRVGNVKVTGDARLRYKDAEDAKSKFDARARVQFNAKVNDRTDAVVRLSSEFELGDATTNTAGNVKVDRAYVNHKFGERVSVKAGRFGQVFGGGLMFDGTFDGAQFNAGNDKVNFQAAYGYIVSGDYGDQKVTELNKLDNVTNTYVGLNGKVGKHVNLGGFYDRVNQDKDGATNVYRNIYGFNTDVNFDKVWVGGEWLKASSVEKSTAWTAGLGYGNYDIKKQGTWGVKAQYFNQKENAPIVDSTWNHFYTTDAKGWMATVDYALQSNVGLSAYYGFDWKTQGNNSSDLGDFYRAELNYKF
ncbi:S-layer homology domain-containing protein [Veillonella caviae]|uniref:S-layer homology domain-containing protein n=1 Tax=Veillonella caviae TaxID=248316 RepID=UPI0023F559B0|nr:S-layer homology domain-containing protein [Veillonella caviae]MCI6406770.1 S-layer homology domain-containing protein [Veillonella caviae]MDY6225160.1 S-layer homology domain-containing protein [Veillonella caviae]